MSSPVPPPAAALPCSDWRLVMRMLGLAWRYRTRCVQVLALQFTLLGLGIVGLASTGVAVLPLPAVPFLPDPPATWSPVQVLAFIAGGILLCAGLRAWLNYSYAVAVNILVQQKLVVDLRSEVYAKLQRLDFRFYDANSTGSIITRVTGDVQNVRMFLDQVLIPSIIMVVSLAVYVAYMASLSPLLTVACLATTPILAVASVVFSKRIQPRYAANRILVERLVQHFTESLQGMQVIKAFGREAEDRKAFTARNDDVLNQQRGVFWRVSLFSPAVGMLTRVNLIVLMSLGGWLVIQGRLPLGAGLVVFAGLLEQFSGQVNQLAAIVNSVQQSLVAARRVFEILDAPIAVLDPPQAPARKVSRGAVHFERVSFGYSGADDAVLHEVDLEVQAGKCVAILGATGAGKSALMSLVPRFFDPQAGRILVDGIDARDYRVADLRRGIGIVFQESFLFSNTIAANLGFGAPDATREQLERAARIAQAHDFITALPQGYDTVLGEGGNTLSGGQRHRLALARALVHEPAILLLDDPTAAIDAQTEHAIFTALDHAISGRTTFIVAHRVSTLRRADLIVVLENGRIVQRGTHAQLLAEPGAYRRVAALQLLDARELDAPPLLAIPTAEVAPQKLEGKV
ncbi:MAG: ABC transporter ATP-binding protein [Verrucomicrobia bacterium]|nr:MAG: ABC transporter ATP-binding protein [Verrucomicrobiota bacterium]